MTGGEFALVREVARALLPDEPALPADTRHRVERDVLDFVEGQIGRMPRCLRAPYRIGLTLVTMLSVFTHGHRYRRLPPAARRAYLGACTGTSSGIVDNLIRPIATCVLLAYYDHPLIRRRLEDTGAPP